VDRCRGAEEKQKKKLPATQLKKKIKLDVYMNKMQNGEKMYMNKIPNLVNNEPPQKTSGSNFQHQLFKTYKNIKFII
jgi:hypothetical protein